MRNSPWNKDFLALDAFSETGIMLRCEPIDGIAGCGTNTTSLVSVRVRRSKVSSETRSPGSLPLAAAQKKLTTALIGAVILFSTWVIMNIVRGFFGLETIRGGGGSSGQFDCCSIVGGQMKNKTACCQLADSHHCVSNRYQSSSATCNQLKIDWNCWSKKFGGGQNPDPNGYCQSGN